MPKLARSQLFKVGRASGARALWQIGDGAVDGSRAAHWMLTEGSFGRKRAGSLLIHQTPTRCSITLCHEAVNVMLPEMYPSNGFGNLLPFQCNNEESLPRVLSLPHC
jgi:hypothetical protein